MNSYNTPFKFNAKELDDETGNYYYGARYYNPKTSIWLSVDPLADSYQGWSPYNYTLQNPVNFVDPNGMYVTGGPGDGKKDNEETYDEDREIYSGYANPLAAVEITGRKKTRSME